MTVRHIGRGAYPLGDVAVVIEERNGARQGPPEAAVGLADPVFVCEEDLVSMA